MPAVQQVRRETAGLPKGPEAQPTDVAAAERAPQQRRRGGFSLTIGGVTVGSGGVNVAVGDVNGDGRDARRRGERRSDAPRR